MRGRRMKGEEDGVMRRVRVVREGGEGGERRG